LGDLTTTTESERERATSYRKAAVRPLSPSMSTTKIIPPPPIPPSLKTTHLEPGLLLLLSGRGRCRERAQVAVAALSGAVHCLRHSFESLSLLPEGEEKRRRTLAALDVCRKLTPASRLAARLFSVPAVGMKRVSEIE